MVTDANTKLASESIRVQELEDEISGYQQQVDEANQERDDANNKAESYEGLLAAADTFITGDESTAANMVADLDGEAFADNALTLYNSLLGKVQSNLFLQYFNSGTTAYAQNDYNSAVTQLTAAVEADPQRQQSRHRDALWYLAYAYYNLGNQTQAAKVFGQLVEYFPKSEYGIQAKQYLDTWGISANAQDTDAANMSGLGADAPEQTVSPAGDNTGAAGGADGTGTGAGSDAGAAGGDAGGGTAGTIYGDGTWDMSDVAWTDPNTGLMYDMYGNMLPGQQQ